MEGGSFTEDSERQVTIWRTPPLEAPRDTYKKVLETCSPLIKGPIRGRWRSGPFSRDLREKRSLYFIRRPCSLGNLEVGGGL
jgi:hypothetical protein